MNSYEFQRLLDDCRKHRIDLILTKSITRFARNTVTLLSTIRELKNLGDDELKDVHIYIDGESGKDYRRHIKTFFRKELPKGVIKELSYRDSKTDNLIQLADMIAGAARRSLERDKDDSYLKIIKKKICHITSEI